MKVNYPLTKKQALLGTPGVLKQKYKISKKHLPTVNIGVEPAKGV